MMIKKIFFFILIIMSTVVKSEEKWVLKNLQFEGLNKIPLSQVLNISHLKIGDSVSNSKIKKIKKLFFLTNRFIKIKAIRKNHTLMFQFIEKPTIDYIKIVSNIKNKDKKKLKNLLIKLKIKSGNMIDNSIISRLIQEIKNIFNKYGKFDSEIKISLFPSSLNKVVLQINISEGNFYRLKSFKVIGSTPDLINKIKSSLFMSQQLSMWNILGNHSFDPLKLELDLKKIKNFYLHYGYMKFFIDYTKIKILKKFKTVDVEIKIHEGNKYKIDKFEIHGNILKNIFLFNKNNSFNRGDAFELKKIKRIKQLILKKYLENGYYKVKIFIFKNIDNKTKLVHVVMNIYSGKQYFIHRIYFRGNYYTRDSFLREQIGLSENNIFRKSDLYHSLQNIIDTDCIDRVSYKIFKRNPNQIDIIYFIKEKNNNGILSFNSGYGIDTGINFNLSVIQKNWLGSGQKYHLHSFFNKNDAYSEIYFSDPYFNSKNLMFINHVFYNQLSNNFKKFNLFKNHNKNYGINSNIEFFSNDKNKFQLGIGYLHNNSINSKTKCFTNNEQYFNNFSKIITKKNFQNLNDLIINFNWNKTYINSELDSKLINLKSFVPENITYLSGKVTIPGSNNSFYKLFLDDYKSIFLNRNQNLKLFFHSRFGFGNSFLVNKQLPVYEHFYAGGSHSIRGFALDSIGLKSNYQSSNRKSYFDKIQKNNMYQNNQLIGGNGLLISNLDVIIPNLIFLKKEQNNFLTSIFLDSGTIWDSHWKNFLNKKFFKTYDYDNPNHIYTATGIQLKWKTVLGKISVSYAYPIGKYDKSKIEKLQFNIGND